jgi:hypothetical protein
MLLLLRNSRRGGSRFVLIMSVTAAMMMMIHSALTVVSGTTQREGELKLDNSHHDETVIPEEILEMTQQLHEAAIDWDAMDNNNNAGDGDARKRRLGQCAQGGDGCAPSRWNVLKLVVDGSYASIRRVSADCNLILPQGPIVIGDVTARCLRDNVPAIDPALESGAATYQTGDVLIGVTSSGGDEPVVPADPPLLEPPKLGNNNMFAKTGTASPIGMSFQNCILAQNDFSKSVPLNTWKCLWTLAFSDGMTNQIMASGTYFNQTRSADPRLQNPPKYQIISITGGTGMFNRIKGFIILTPLDLTKTPPKWWYYIVYKDIW